MLFETEQHLMNALFFSFYHAIVDFLTFSFCFGPKKERHLFEYKSHQQNEGFVGQRGMCY